MQQEEEEFQIIERAGCRITMVSGGVLGDGNKDTSVMLDRIEYTHNSGELQKIQENPHQFPVRPVLCTDKSPDSQTDRDLTSSISNLSQATNFCSFLKLRTVIKVSTTKNHPYIQRRSEGIIRVSKKPH